MNNAATTARVDPRLSSIGLFLLFAAIAIGAVNGLSTLFPGDRAGANLGRAAVYLAVALLLIVCSIRLLKREGLSADRLGLGLSAAHARAFLIGTALAFGHILLLLAVFYLAAPFELRAGPQALEDVALQGLGYLTGNFVEELLFRGCLLILLARWLGATRAIWILALPFGLFHFPGLDAMALAKMICTTGAMHFVYAYAFLATRSLWAAVALHAVGNTLLHEVIGVGEPAALSLHFARDLPATSHLPFFIFFGVTAALALLLSRLPATRRGSAWLQSASN
jgi:uncharacterized protein